MKGFVVSAEQPKWPWQAFDPAEFAKLGQVQANALSEAQQELSKFLQQASEDWRSRAELERELVTELTNNLTAAKSLPEAATAYQQWMARRIELMTKDSQKFFADNQTFMNTMSRFFPVAGRPSDK